MIKLFKKILPFYYKTAKKWADKWERKNDISMSSAALIMGDIRTYDFLKDKKLITYEEFRTLLWDNFKPIKLLREVL